LAKTCWAVVQIDSTDVVHLAYNVQTMAFLAFADGQSLASVSLNLRPRLVNTQYQDRDQNA